MALARLASGGYSFRNLNRINVLLGKNDCGKSRMLRIVEQNVDPRGNIVVSYISPERGGFLIEDVNQEMNLVNVQGHLAETRRKNQFSNFKEQSLIHYRILKDLVLEEIEQNEEIRKKLAIRFDTYVTKLNGLLDNIQIVRQKNRSSFEIQRKSVHSVIQPNEISSGESELISLGIECLLYEKRIDQTKNNFLFLDEPDVHLHPDLQFRLMEFLEELINSNPNFQVVITTHSTAILGALSSSNLTNVAFMKMGETDIEFRNITDRIKDILPVFGAHPLSQIFNEIPILLVEGEDDVRIWQQAVRTSQGRIKIYPVEVGEVTSMNGYELDVDRIISSVYSQAKAYSLRDQDMTTQDINDFNQVIRFKLACRNAENLILSNEALTRMGTNWNALQRRMQEWAESDEGQRNRYLGTVQQFVRDGFPRKTFDLKEIRTLLMYFADCEKPWEIIVGQVIAGIQWNDASDFTIDGDLINFLGEKIVRTIIPATT